MAFLCERHRDSAAVSKGDDKESRAEHAGCKVNTSLDSFLVRVVVTRGTGEGFKELSNHRAELERCLIMTTGSLHHVTFPISSKNLLDSES